MPADKPQLNPWRHLGDEIDSVDRMPENTLGFVYILTDRISGLKYIGKKLVRVMRKRKGRRQPVESDWKRYRSSNRIFQGLCAERPQDIERTIISYHRTKGDLSLAEIALQIESDVLRDDSFANRIINCRIHASHLSRTP